MTVITIIFWGCVFAGFYAYFGYPLVLMLLSRFIARPVKLGGAAYTPSVSILIPVHNEKSVIERKIQNLIELDYPSNAVEVLFISDGSTDGTDDAISSCDHESIRLIAVETRKGKANALNRGLQEARNEIIVFSDASIMLEKNALREIVRPFYDQSIGCVSGEDHIQEAGGEGAYGRYELWLRNLESRIHSLVGASGSFYAQRRSLVKPFAEGLAPDFLSVLVTVENGYRAITEPRALGYMSSVKSHTDEFNRKIRTLVRGMSALFYKKRMLNIFQFGMFSFFLLSHKLVRWLVPYFLILLLLSNLALLGNQFYWVFLGIQIAFYGLAILAKDNIAGLGSTLPGKLSLYFSMVNISILIAWKRYLTGFRQEIWDPSKRTSP